MYAIVDIETTGGFSSANRIIEIAVVLHDGNRITSEFQTLLNPGMRVPSFISGLTGIYDEMLEGAPGFSEIAEDLLQILSGKVFVAHNVNFDLGFVKDAFAREGIRYSPSALCTVRLSRKIFPGYKSYSLGRLCDMRNIRIENRHRAMGDAYATALLFGQLVEADQEGFIQKSLKGRKKDIVLPPNISREQYADLPEGTGVYFFHDQNGRVIYVGKALNIKSRFKGHFTGSAKVAMKSEIHDVSYELTGSEFLALLVETLEIKKHWPKYNRALKVKSSRWGIYVYLDQSGYRRLSISKTGSTLVPVCTFSSHAEAWHFVIRQAKTFNLCPKLCGIQKAAGACYDHQLGNCAGACCGAEEAEAHNARLEEMLAAIKLEEKTILIKEVGRRDDEEAALLFERGLLAAFGFISREQDFATLEAVVEHLTPVKPVPETSYYLRAYLEKGNRGNIYYLEHT